MASTFTEYLRLSKTGEDSALLEICMYEALGELRWDEEGEPAEPPAEIDGKTVVGVDDGIIVGGDLTCSNDDDLFFFTKNSLPDAIGWLASKGWESGDGLVAELAKAVA